MKRRPCTFQSSGPEIRRRLERVAARSVRTVTPVAPAKPTLVLVPGDPRREDEVQRLLGEPEPSSAEIQRRIIGRALAGLRYAEAELGGHIRLVLARVMERARQSGGDWNDNVVNLG